MSNFILYSKDRIIESQPNIIKGRWDHRPTVNEVTKVTHDPQMSVALLRGSRVTVGNSTFCLELEDE